MENLQSRLLDNGYIDFPDILEPPIQTRNGKLCYFDTVSKIYRLRNPEEIVRQRMLVFLHEYMQIPYSALKVEEHLAHYIDHTNKRMDVCVLAENTDGTQSPVLVVECKSSSCPITEKVYVQVDEYAYHLNVNTICVTNGLTIRFLTWNIEMNDYQVPIYLPSYTDLCSESNLAVISQDATIYQRPAFSSVFSNERFIEAIDWGIIGEETPIKFAPFILNLYDALMDTSSSVQSLDIAPYQFECDGGLHYTEFGNNGGGHFDGDYHFLSIIDHNGVSQFINFGIFAVAKTTNSIQYGNSRGRTYLIVAISNLEHAHSALQLTIEDHVLLTDKTAIITHNGKMAVGNLGSVASAEVLEYVVSRDPRFKLDSGRLYLGEIDYSKPISIDDECVKAFLGNLIRYSLLRDEYRQIVKARSKKA